MCESHASARMGGLDRRLPVKIDCTVGAVVSSISATLHQQPIRSTPTCNKTLNATSAILPATSMFGSNQLLQKKKIVL
uniref:SFRICE_005110 n=1 Tax=Spodoptera frugiperda TaxID=7108 RepID=A0A2H1VH87_SPOFR